uniref:PR domain containing 1b, with ZNF domain n=1 Tax=Hippocampus comes TaxID=109280 RepID=A0A3Q2XDL3_HIPCM
MYSGYSSLNATLSMKNSPPDKLHESGDRFRQVSPMRDNAAQREALAFGRTESNGATLGTESVRKSSFDGVKERDGGRDRQESHARTHNHLLFSAFPADDTDASCFTGVFKATLVELDDPAAPGSTPPASPDVDCNQSDMDNLVDTLKSMGPSLRPRGMGLRGPAGIPVSALPPIVEDAPSPVTSDIIASPTKRTEAGPAGEARNGIFALPADLGLKRNTSRDTRSPMELMKKEQPGPRDMPLRATATQSILMRKSSDASDEHKSLNGNATQQPSKTRLENSVIYGSYKSSSVDQTQENSKFHRSVFRSGSLPELGSSNILKELSEVNTATDSSSRFERLSFLINSPPSSSSFSSGSDDVTPRRSLPLQQNFTSSSSSSYSKFGQTLGQGIGASAISAPLQRSFSHESISVGAQQNSLINNNLLRGPQVQKTEPERNVKYRAFPDAYLTKEKEHGKLNPRPGKVYIFDRPGMCGQRIELCGDIADATSWELQETISIRVVRGGWVLYEQRNFKGEKIALDEGDIELTCPFQQPEAEGEQQTNGQKVAEEQKGEENGETSEGQTKTKAAKRSIIGSVRRAVRDYSVPEISLFPEENAEGKKVIFRDTSEDARIFGFPIKANSIIINAGLWLVFSKPFFEGSPRVLEVGGYSNPASWGVEQPYVGSLHPLKIVRETKVENISEPTVRKSYFTGKSRILTSNMKDFMTRVDRQQGAFMYSVGSLKVRGGIWVGYEKEGYRGHQYLLEEGEYHDWRVWGGSNSELRSVRVLQADLSDPLMVMFEQPEEEEGAVAQEENTFEVTEAIPDVELFGFKINTRSIQVFSGVWVAYSHVDFSGNQYILEKGFYSTSADWGSRDTRICSVQPVRLAPADGNRTRNEILLYSEPDYKGECRIFNYKEEAATEEFQTKSCRVVGGSWVLYENKDFSGTMYVLSEGGYRSLTSMGCPPNTFIRSVKAVPMSFSVPSISLFGLEGLEGREISTDSELLNMQAEDNLWVWVLFEFGNYRGRQFLLEPTEITNWPKFSSVQTIGSLYPVRQKRHFFRIRNADSHHLMSIQGGVEELKSGRVVVTPEAEPMSDIWFYQDGQIKNKLSPIMSLQVMGNVEPGAKLVLWNVTRQPSQTWMAQMRGRLSSITYPGMVVDVKGGQSYDKDHVVIMPESDERLSQQWEIVLIN